MPRLKSPSNFAGGVEVETMKSAPETLAATLKIPTKTRLVRSVKKLPMRMKEIANAKGPDNTAIKNIMPTKSAKLSMALL